MSRSTQEVEALPSLREAKRALTRRRLLDAARAAFNERNYLQITIDDIAQRAAVSRATVYLYYDGKDAVLADLLAEDIERQEVLFRRLAALGNPKAAQMEAWIENYLEKTRRAAPMALALTAAAAVEPVWFRRFNEHRDRLIEILGEGIPAFRLPSTPGAAREEHRAAAHLLLYQFEQFCMQAAQPGATLDRRAGCRALARNFLAFIAAGRPDRGV